MNAEIKKEMPFPDIDYPTTRESIAQSLKIRANKLRSMLREIGIPDKKALSPRDIKRFRETYIGD